MRAAIYARYSAGPNQTEVSIEGQVSACRKYIKEKKYRLTEVYADEHITGKTDRRPKFQQMISDAEDRKFDVLVVYSIDRFSRGEYDLPYYRMVLNKSDVRLESAAERIPEGPEGYLLQHVLEGLAVYYSLELSRKIKRGMNSRAEKAIPVGGPTPFGYRLKDKAYVIEDDEAEAIRECFRMILSGKTPADCTRYLNGRGFRTPAGKPFVAGRFRKLILNPKYTGLYKYGDIEIEGGMPQIVDPETFRAAEEKLKVKRLAPRGDFALTGKLICGECGTAMSGTSGTGKNGRAHYYYQCRKKDLKSVPRDALEHTVADRVREVLTSPQELDYIVGKLFILQNEKSPHGSDMDPVRQKLARVGRQIERAYDIMIESGKDDRLLARIDRLKSEEQDLKTRLARMNLGRDLTEDEIRAGLIRNFRTGMTDAEIIRELVHKVVLYDDRIFIILNILDGGDFKVIDLEGFGQGSLCSTIEPSGRTLFCQDGFLIFGIKK